MKWKKRAKEIEALKAKHGKDRSLAHPFPDLSVEQRTAPTSDRLATPPALKKEMLQAILGPEYIVGYLHKSGYQVFRKTDAPNLGKKI
jgi:hypothetical protein